MKTTKWMVLAIGILAGACGGTDGVEIDGPADDGSPKAAIQPARADSNIAAAADEVDTSGDADSAATMDQPADEDAATDATDGPTEDDASGTTSAECTPDECGPGLGAPNFLCDDGSMGGPVCERDRAGACGWTIRQCPATDDECTPEECGTPIRPPIVDCSDGSTGGPVCGRDRAGECGWSVRECPAECQPDSCGDQPDWLQICADGTELMPVCTEAPASLTDTQVTCNWVLPDCG